MNRVCEGVAPLAVGLNLTVTVLVLPLARLKLLPLKMNGDTRLPIVTCKTPLPLFLILSFLLLVELTFSVPKRRLPETLNVPNGGVGVAVGVAV